MRLNEFCREFAEIVRDAAPGWTDRGMDLIGRLSAAPGWIEEILERLILDPEFSDLQKDSVWPNEIRIFKGNEFTLMVYLWEPGQQDSIHDHNALGMAGIVAQTLRETKYDRVDDCTREEYAELAERQVLKLERGQTTLFPPLNEGIHRIENCGTGVGITVNAYCRSLRREGYVQFFDHPGRNVRKVYRPSRFKQLLAVKAVRELLGPSGDLLLEKGLEGRSAASLRKEIERALEPPS